MKEHDRIGINFRCDTHDEPEFLPTPKHIKPTPSASYTSSPQYCNHKETRPWVRVLLTVLYTLLSVFIIHALFNSQASVCEQAIKNVIGL